MSAASLSKLSVAQVVPCTQAEGPGRRFALWLQGCPLRCVGCCNPEFLPFEGGERIAIAELSAQIEQAVKEKGIEGVTLLGGEPFAQSAGCARLAIAAHELGLTVMVFSGLTFAELRSQTEAGVADLLGETDILVDGPYDHSQPETERRWIGSRNQQIHFLSRRCDSNDPRWNEPNTLELRLSDGRLSVNGFPAPSAVALWKKPRRHG